MIDRVYQTIRMLANTEIRGNMKPSDFDKALYKVIIDIFEQYVFDLNKWTNRMNKGLVSPGEQNIIDLLQEKIDFHVQSSSLVFDVDKFKLPVDLGYLGTIIYTTVNSEVDLCKNLSEFNHLKRFKHTQPSVDFPVGLRTGKTIEILPATIQSNVKASYRRTPKIPKWTYVKDPISKAEMFNPSAPDYSDIDMHPSEFGEIVTRLCVEFGINLKEEDLKAAGSQEEIQNYNIENSN